MYTLYTLFKKVNKSEQSVHGVFSNAMYVFSQSSGNYTSRTPHTKPKLTRSNSIAQLIIANVHFVHFVQKSEQKCTKCFLNAMYVFSQSNGNYLSKTPHTKAKQPRSNSTAQFIIMNVHFVHFVQKSEQK
jgi:hypothetical protein